MVKRCLILVPKSVLRQWQEELYEKFNLFVPRFDGSEFFDLNNDSLVEPVARNPWDTYPVMLAGSQLAKRADSRDQVLQAQGWDLVVVDEAHHARRKDFKVRIYRPNRLLSLLNEMNERGKAGSLLLMTATPMQVHPLEVWDLLKLLGMGGRWGTDEDYFLDFFGELRKTFHDADWDFIFDMLWDYLETGGEIDPAFEAQVKEDIGLVKWSQLKALPAQHGHREQTIKQLGTGVQSHIKEMARRHTPLRRYVFRNTRSLLRKYQQEGILKENVPTRRPEIVRVPMKADEFTLYERIDEYINHFYQKYESERRGPGFVMTVYRRRLTSSFYAVRCSLERRLKFLKGELDSDRAYDDDDIEQDDLSMDVSEDILSESDANRFKAELDYVKDFIQELKLLSVADSKLEYLKNELHKVFMERSTVLVFTQYTDTMDYLRDQLVEVYGTSVACYSGRGGEVWNGIAWVITTKEVVKKEFKEGQVRILICSDSASEGLNLQTCGVLINYDMPWNPMRVEQRIGRIDRIGQQYPDVWISNYFYMDTIEDIIYQRLADRIDWFEVVVGDLQPILAEVGEVTKRLAMLPAKEREAQLEQEIEALKQRLENRELESLNLDDFTHAGSHPTIQPSPVKLKDLEFVLTTSSISAHLFQRHPQIKDAYLLNWNGDMLPVTFSPACFDEHPDTVKFLSYGSPLLDELLALGSPPQPDSDGAILRVHADDMGLSLCARYLPGRNGAFPNRVDNLTELNRWLSSNMDVRISEEAKHKAQEKFIKAFQEVQEKRREIILQRRKSVMLAEKAKSQHLLVKAALIELALGQQHGLFGTESYPSAFNELAIKGLQRHGYPWGALLKLAYESELSISEEDEYYQRIQGSNRESLKGKFFQLIEGAKRLVKSLSTSQTDTNGSWPISDPSTDTKIFTV